MVKIIGICGGSGSGKTTISEELKRKNNTNISLVSQDSYYKSYSEYTLEERKRINYDHPNAFDINLLEAQLKELKNGNEIESPIYSFENYTRQSDTNKISSNNIIILEGMLIFHYPQIRECLDDAIFLDANENTRLKRMVLRDEKERGRTKRQVIEQYIRDMKPMHEKYVEPLKKYADVSINSSGNLEKTVQEIRAYINRQPYIEEDYR